MCREKLKTSKIKKVRFCPILESSLRQQSGTAGFQKKHFKINGHLERESTYYLRTGRGRQGQAVKPPVQK